MMTHCQNFVLYLEGVDLNPGDAPEGSTEVRRVSNIKISNVKCQIPNIKCVLS